MACTMYMIMLLEVINWVLVKREQRVFVYFRIVRTAASLYLVLEVPGTSSLLIVNLDLDPRSCLDSAEKKIEVQCSCGEWREEIL